MNILFYLVLLILISFKYDKTGNKFKYSILFNMSDVSDITQPEYYLSQSVKPDYSDSKYYYINYNPNIENEAEKQKFIEKSFYTKSSGI